MIKKIKLKILSIIFMILSITILVTLVYKLFFQPKPQTRDYNNFISVNRWYLDQQVTLGKKIYQINCLSCHGKEGQSTPNWQKTLSDGSYPPPPLNGTDLLGIIPKVFYSKQSKTGEKLLEVLCHHLKP